jgi:hypothetical protein
MQLYPINKNRLTKLNSYPNFLGNAKEGFNF